ncbi:MAG: type II toxin-antitoxin system RelE/ParE family toxin [Tunicatimonas sp.]|uniref:type II toxin-antitoxin system RelE/ParE family toxin n=1 Tax=Tunicatimonas sp. TaxID=1940096 RepID=UPI003C76B3EA
MNFKIKVSLQFEKELKKLAKKYPSLKKEYPQLLANLRMNPTLGVSLGKNVYKVRMTIASKGKGKSGGARVITYLQLDEETVLLLTMYNKGTKDNITNKEILSLIEKYGS